MSIEGFVRGLKAGRLIDCIPHDGVLKLFVGAHVACGDFTRVNSHPRVDVTTVLGFQLLFERLESLLLFEGRPAGFPGVGVWVWIDPDGNAEVGHDGIA